MVDEPAVSDMMRLNGYWKPLAGGMCLLVAFLIGCRQTAPSSAPPNLAAPTIASMFTAVDTPTPSPITKLPTAPPQPTPDLAAVTVPATAPIITKIIYADALAANWTWQDGTDGMEVDLSNTKYTHSGQTAIAMTPSQDFGKLYFSVRLDSETVYLRDKVLGVSFWLGSGDAQLQPDDLAVAVVGSNDFPFWTAGDDSVAGVDFGDGDGFAEDGELPVFSETRLYFLEVDRTLPPQTWIQIEVWLDELIYDPDYTYVTGFYLKNDAGFFQTVYIDDVQLMMRAE